jgi:hypothetical protein
MDAAAKRDMWKMLSSVTPGRSVLLTVSLDALKIWTLKI